LSRMFTLFASDRIKFPCMKKIKNWFLGQNNIYTSLGKREFTSLVTVRKIVHIPTSPKQSQG
jgi:hypothetical protein